MMYKIFPNQLKSTQITDLKTKKLYTTIDYNEIQNNIREKVKPTYVKNGLNTSADMFHFCEVSSIFGFIEWKTYIREVTIPEDDMLIFDVKGFNYLPKSCFPDGCVDCSRHPDNNRGRLPPCTMKQEVHRQYLGGYLAPTVFLGKREFIWDLKTIKHLIAEGANPHLITERIVEELVKYGKIEIFKLFYELTSGFESVDFIQRKKRWVSPYHSSYDGLCQTKMDKLQNLAFWSIEYERRNYLQFLIEQGLDVHVDNDGLLKLALWRALNHSITCFKYLYNLEPTYFNDKLEWFQKELNRWKTPIEAKEKFLESLKIRIREKPNCNGRLYPRAILEKIVTDFSPMRNCFVSHLDSPCFTKATWYPNPSNLPFDPVKASEILSIVENDKTTFAEILQEETEKDKIMLEPVTEIEYTPAEWVEQIVSVQRMDDSLLEPWFPRGGHPKSPFCKPTSGDLKPVTEPVTPQYPVGEDGEVSTMVFEMECLGIGT